MRPAKGRPQRLSVVELAQPIGIESRLAASGTQQSMALSVNQCASHVSMDARPMDYEVGELLLERSENSQLVRHSWDSRHFCGFQEPAPVTPVQAMRGLC